MKYLSCPISSTQSSSNNKITLSDSQPTESIALEDKLKSNSSIDNNINNSINGN